MDKRYQVFVSSTFADLQEERQQVMQALMEMDCIPAGMEIFPAVDEEQWQFIKRIIDDCDYYLLIVGGRYGTTDEDGVSYTEKEFDYAVASGLKVIALLHQDPSTIQAGKTDQNTELAAQLIAFREKISENRLVKFWNTPDQLPGLVALSLSKTIKTYPAIGWVRANAIASQDILLQLNDLQKENSSLKSKLVEMQGSQTLDIPDMAELDDVFEIKGTRKQQSQGHDYEWSYDISWADIFALISPHLIEHPNDSSVKLQIKTSVFDLTGKYSYSKTLDDQCFQTIKIQLTAMGLVNVKYSKTTKGGMGLFWSLTNQGEHLMMQLRTVKKNA